MARNTHPICISLTFEEIEYLQKRKIRPTEFFRQALETYKGKKWQMAHDQEIFG